MGGYKPLRSWTISLSSCLDLAVSEYHHVHAQYISTQYIFVKVYYVKLYMNIRLQLVFNLKHAVLNVTHKKAMRIKDHLIIIKIDAVAFIIVTIYIEHLLYIWCVIGCFTKTWVSAVADKRMCTFGEMLVNTRDKEVGRWKRGTVRNHSCHHSGNFSDRIALKASMQ